MNQIILRSFAKLNLFLKIQNKRIDGFHNIVTIFERINLFDEIQFKATNTGKIQIQCNHPHVPLGSSNLIHKVAIILQKKYQVKQGVKVVINKRIPVAAGLAGGSSNAATAIEGLTKIWKIKLNLREKQVLAGQIGSDVAFFLMQHPWGVGVQRGELVSKLPIKAKLWHILVVPKVKMRTPKVYQGLKLKPQEFGAEFYISKGRIEIAKCQKNRVLTNLLTKTVDNANILIHNLKRENTLEITRYLTNDLQPVVEGFCPRIKFLKQRLKSLNIQGVMLSGSGPSVYGITSSREEAINAAAILSKKYSQVFVVRTL
ncbi:MAG: 4-(cytidine 5'-diphospho)-2-C-methyl-D-erythritol kinase [Candidatus Omnitrophica bacterium]|nr:4-(cytidine 5'-diphospho)-2-C-methyl-D-erythritol kinase [Candidatus Omnitrophota bacterium]MCB9747612.1 4-(cytidine 5'-diphospho)-2-C-methyl-D-erythritol kinase [Candidatus Omnitrophota bacterium]